MSYISSCTFSNCKCNSPDFISIISKPSVEIENTCFYKCTSNSVSSLTITSERDQANLLKYNSIVSCEGEDSTISLLNGKFEIKFNNISHITETNSIMHAQNHSLIKILNCNFEHSKSQSIMEFGTNVTDIYIDSSNFKENQVDYYFDISEYTSNKKYEISMCYFVDNKNQNGKLISNEDSNDQGILVNVIKSIFTENEFSNKYKYITFEYCKFQSESKETFKNYYLNTAFCEGIINPDENTTILSKFTDEEIIGLIIICIAIAAEIVELLIYLYHSDGKNKQYEADDYDYDYEYSDFDQPEDFEYDYDGQYYNQEQGY